MPETLPRLRLGPEWQRYAVAVTTVPRQHGRFGAGDDVYAVRVLVDQGRARFALPEGFVAGATDLDCLTLGWRIGAAVEWLQEPPKPEEEMPRPMGQPTDYGWVEGLVALAILVGLAFYGAVRLGVDLGHWLIGG